MNINSKHYWENKFSSGNWSRSGRKQTLEYAKGNIQYLNIPPGFKGTILDFGCAHGDAIPVYLKRFPHAVVNGFDISESAINFCRNRYGISSAFYNCEPEEIPRHDIIIASHVMEHISDDSQLIKLLLKKCSELYVFVPYKENPLYFEHIHSYDENYYSDLGPRQISVFIIKYKIWNSPMAIVKKLLDLKIPFQSTFRKNIIMYQFVNN